MSNNPVRSLPNHANDNKSHQMLRTINDDSISGFQPRTSKKPPRRWRQNVKKAEDPDLGNDHVWLIGDAYHVMLPGRYDFTTDLPDCPHC